MMHDACAHLYALRPASILDIRMPSFLLI